MGVFDWRLSLDCVSHSWCLLKVSAAKELEPSISTSPSFARREKAINLNGSTMTIKATCATPVPSRLPTPQ
jgi:hypothetical protein